MTVISIEASTLIEKLKLTLLQDDLVQEGIVQLPSRLMNGMILKVGVEDALSQY